MKVWLKRFNNLELLNEAVKVHSQEQVQNNTVTKSRSLERFLKKGYR